MKIMLKTLARRSLAASRPRNLVAVLAIMLTAVLFTSVTTISLGAMDSMTLTMQILKGSKSDGDLRNMTAEQFAALERADFIESYGLRMAVGFLTDTVRHNIEFDVLDETQAELTFCNPSHGTVPQAANEIVASDAALRELGAKPEVGAAVTLRFCAHGQEYVLPMVVSGWYEATNDQISMLWAGIAFRDAYPEIFQNTYVKDRELAGTYASDFIAKSTVGLQDKMNDWVYSVGGEPEDMKADNYLAAVINTTTNQPMSLSVYIMGGIVAALFLLCGYLLIYNVFDIAVMQEIRRYGLYRTIGMSRKQVKKLINRQALWLSCIGIPLGLAIGFFVGKAALPVVMDTMSSEYQNIVVSVEPSPVIFLGAAALTALTVFLSTRKPIRVAANTPPIEAFHYVERAGAGPRARGRFTEARIYRMAWSNLGRNRRRTAFIMLSLMLCIALLNGVGIAAASLDVEKQVNYMIRTDYAVVNAVSANGQKGFTSREQSLDPKLMQAISALPGVKDAAPVYKNTAQDTNITYDFGIPLTQETMVNQVSGLPHAATEDYYWFGLGEDGRPVCNVYGMEEISISRMDLREGETDPHALYSKMEDGQGVLLGVQVNRQDMSLADFLDFLDVGDTITVYRDGRPLMELPVLSKAAVNGDDEEIGYTCNGPMSIGGDGLLLYLPSSIYEQLYDTPSVYKYAFDVEETERENVTAYLEDAMAADPDLYYTTAESARESAEGTRTMIYFVGILIGSIFGIVGVLNLINTIITTIIARRHEFATMQSIGMTPKQLAQMMTFEGIYYAAGACVLGTVVSILTGLTLVRGLTGSVWYFTFQFTLFPALITCMVLIVISAVIPAVALRLFNKGSIVEQLRIAE